MTDRRTDIVAQLEKSGEDSIAFFTSLTPDQLSMQVYQDGARWTAKQVLAHFITVERSMHWLFKNISSGGSGSPEDFDIERFNRTQTSKLDELTLDELFMQFKAVREDTVSIVRELSEEDLDREGLHAFHGHGKLERFIRWAYEHARIHEDEIRKVL
jgi:hypothetical protein